MDIVNQTIACIPVKDALDNVGSASAIVSLASAIGQCAGTALTIFAGRSAADFLDTTGKVVQLEAAWQKTYNDVHEALDGRQPALLKYFPEFLNKCQADLLDIEDQMQLLKIECDSRSRLRNLLAPFGPLALGARRSFDKLTRMDENLKSSSVSASAMAVRNAAVKAPEEQRADILRMQHASAARAKWIAIPVPNVFAKAPKQDDHYIDELVLADIEAGHGLEEPRSSRVSETGTGSPGVAPERPLSAPVDSDGASSASIRSAKSVEVATLRRDGDVEPTSMFYPDECRDAETASIASIGGEDIADQRTPTAVTFRLSNLEPGVADSDSLPDALQVHSAPAARAMPSTDTMEARELAEKLSAMMMGGRDVHE